MHSGYLVEDLGREEAQDAMPNCIGVSRSKTQETYAISRKSHLVGTEGESVIGHAVIAV